MKLFFYIFYLDKYYRTKINYNIMKIDTFKKAIIEFNTILLCVMIISIIFSYTTIAVTTATVIYLVKSCEVYVLYEQLKKRNINEFLED